MVKCFSDPSLPGTVIQHKAIKNLPPVIILKDNQALLHLHSKDFSFIEGNAISQLYHLLAEKSITANLIQTGAVILMVCTDDREDKVNQLAVAAAAIFGVQVEKQLSLLTIRHYTPKAVAEMTEGKNIVLQQQSGQTVQFLLR